MKKLSRKRRQWHDIHARKLNRRRIKKKKSRTRKHPQPSRSNPHRVHGSFTPIHCPEVLSLEDNFDGVVKLLDDIRMKSQKHRNKRIHIDFKPIRTIKPSAALVLAAELDRWNRQLAIRNSKLVAVDAEEWDSTVRRLLREMGFFKLLRVVSIPEEKSSTGIQYVQFCSGTKVDGKVIDDLRRLHLEPFVSVPNKHLLYAAVTEAMTNVVHHAYGDQTSLDVPKHWWLSAAYDGQSREVAVMIYDQGSGIPATLPRKFKERIRELLPENLTKNDAHMIQAAHHLSRTATLSPSRGHGLQRDIRRYIEELDCHGMYRVISNRGEYIVETGASSDKIISHKHPLSGTLIEWRLKQ